MAKDKTKDMGEVEVIKGFKLKVKKNGYASIQITEKRHVILDFRSDPSQVLLKEVYDASAKYAKWIDPPRGYKAPWQP